MNLVYRPFGALRFLLAMLVVIQHGLLVLPSADRELFYNLELGVVAVTVFFALSGFIVAEALSTFYKNRPLAFLANRVLRIVPVYLVVLALSIALAAILFQTGYIVRLDNPLAGSPLGFRIVLGGLLDILPGLSANRVSGQDFAFVPFAWSLRIEFAFYIVAFAICWLAKVFSPTRAAARMINVAALTLAYVLFAMLAICKMNLPLQASCIPFFAFGICAFVHARNRTLATAILLAASYAAVVFAFVGWHQRGHANHLLQLSGLTLLLAAMIVLSQSPILSPRLKSLDRQFGDLSYPLYISHGIVLILLSSLYPTGSIQLYATFCAASLCLASILHVLIERPIRHLRTAIRGSTL